MDKLLRATQVAEILQIHKNTLIRMIKRQQINGIRIGALWKVSQSELERFLKEGNAPIGVDFFRKEEDD